MKVSLFIIIVVAIVAGAFFMFRAAPPPNPRDANGACLLSGDARFVDSMGELVVQPAAGEEWTDVTLTLRGQGIGATNNGQPTGAFTLERPLVRGRTALKIETFQKPSGERWVRIVMQPTDLEIVAMHSGERCRLTKSF
jgi:hypothetical protein